jgi:hypothetical protein
MTPMPKLMFPHAVSKRDPWVFGSLGLWVFRA